jgi:hypothetical protein
MENLQSYERHLNENVVAQELTPANIKDLTGKVQSITGKIAYIAADCLKKDTMPATFEFMKANSVTTAGLVLIVIGCSMAEGEGIPLIAIGGIVTFKGATMTAELSHRLSSKGGISGAMKKELAAYCDTVANRINKEIKWYDYII